MPLRARCAIRSWPRREEQAPVDVSLLPELLGEDAGSKAPRANAMLAPAPACRDPSTKKFRFHSNSKLATISKVESPFELDKNHHREPPRGSAAG